MKKLSRLISALTMMCMLFTLFTFEASAADDTFTLEVEVAPEYAAGTVTLYVGGVSYTGESGTETDATSVTDLSDGGKLYTYEGISSSATMYLKTYANRVTKKRTYYFGNIDGVIGSTQRVTAEFYDEFYTTNRLWRSTQVVTYTKAMADYMKVPETDAAQDAYNKYVKDTPYFQRWTENPLQMSKQSERLEYINGLDETDDNLYFFEDIQRSYTRSDLFYMSLVVFTESDIPEGATMDEAAEIVKGNGKPTIFYKGQIHGNEPAPGEATLAMIKALDSDYGAELLKKVNVIIIPRVSMYSAYDYLRNVDSLNGEVNPNRDCMMSITNEMTGTYKVFYKFMPEIVIDAHEYTTHTSKTAVSRSFPDISYTVGNTLNTISEVAALSKSFVEQIRDDAKAAGFFPYIYDDTISNKDDVRYSAVKTVYNHPFFAQLGCVSFLVESPGGCGSYTGEDWIERRVTGHFIAAKSIFDYAAANADTLRDTVKEARDKIISDGATYNDDDMFVLEHGVSKTEGTELEFERIFYDIRTGTIDNRYTVDLYPNDKAVRSRVRPTAYFIPKSGAWLEKDNLASVVEADKKLQYERALETLDKHSVDYIELPAGTSVYAEQYAGTASEATLLPEKVVTFKNGGYVIPMNQMAGNVVGGLFEPDVTDNSGNPGTFMQQGLYTAATDGSLPVYRYVRDLDTTDMTYGGIKLYDGESPAGLSAVHKTTVNGSGSIIGLDANKLYEYIAEGGAEYISVRTGSTKISHLEPGTYSVRYRYADGTFSTDVELTIEDQYTGLRFDFFKPEFYDVKSFAMTGSKVLLTAIEGAVYKRNGDVIDDYEELSDIGAIAITVNEGLNNFTASSEDGATEYGAVSVYGASLERYSSSVYGVSLHKQIDSAAVEYTTESPNTDISNLVDENHPIVYQANNGNITSNLTISATTDYNQFQQGLGFYIAGELESDFRPIALTANSGTYCKFTPVIKAGGRLYVDTLGSGEIDTGITVSSDEWHDIGIFSDFLNSGMTDLYLDGVLVARGKIYSSSRTTVYANLGDGPTNCYIGDAVNCVVVAENDWPKAVTAAHGSQSKMFSNRASSVKVYPSISIEEGSSASSVKVTLTDFSDLTGYEVKLFANGEMLNIPVATDGTDTAINLETSADMSDSTVYAAVVDADENIFSGFSGPLKSGSVTVDIATTPPSAQSIFSGSIASGKVAVLRSEFPEEYKTSTAHVIEVKADDTVVTTVVSGSESFKEVAVATTSKKVFLWILSNLYPLSEAIVE